MHPRNLTIAGHAGVLVPPETQGSHPRMLRLVPTDAPDQATDDRPKRWQGHDPVFIHRDQIARGTRLIYFGRCDHGSQWVVTDVFSHTNTGRRRFQDRVRHTTDSVMLRRVNSNETHEVGFIYLSYSAIWRIDPDHA